MSAPLQKPWVVQANICINIIQTLVLAAGWEASGKTDSAKHFFFSFWSFTKSGAVGECIDLNVEPGLIGQNFQEAN